jgi:hypothetical protein
LINHAYFNGVLLSVLGKDSNIEIQNTSFNNNNGVYGGIYVSQRSIVKLENSTFYTNFAVSASIALVENEAQILFVNCTMLRNSAINTGILGITNSIYPSKLVESTVNDQILVGKAQIHEEIVNLNACVNLCYSTENYRNYLKSNPDIIEIYVSDDLEYFRFVHICFLLIKGR